MTDHHFLASIAPPCTYSSGMGSAPGPAIRRPQLRPERVRIGVQPSPVGQRSVEKGRAPRDDRPAKSLLDLPYYSCTPSYRRDSLPSMDNAIVRHF